MAISRSRSLKQLETSLLQAKLGPTGTESPAIVAQSPDTPMAPATAKHYTSLELLSGGRASADQSPITDAPSTGATTAFDPTSYKLPTAEGPLGGTQPLSTTGAAPEVQSDFMRGASNVASKVGNVASQALKYNPKNLVREELLKKPLTAAAKSLLGKKASILSNPVVKYFLGG